MTTKRSQYPTDVPAWDWADVSAWEDAGRPDIAADGTWRTPECIGCGCAIAEDDDAIATRRGAMHTDCAEELPRQTATATRVQEDAGEEQKEISR